MRAVGVEGMGREWGAEQVSRLNGLVEGVVSNYCKRQEEEQVAHKDNLGFKVLRLHSGEASD